MAIGLMLHKNKPKKISLFPRLEALFLFTSWNTSTAASARSLHAKCD